MDGNWYESKSILRHQLSFELGIPDLLISELKFAVIKPLKNPTDNLYLVRWENGKFTANHTQGLGGKGGFSGVIG